MFTRLQIPLIVFIISFGNVFSTVTFWCDSIAGGDGTFNLGCASAIVKLIGDHTGCDGVFLMPGWLEYDGFNDGCKIQMWTPGNKPITANSMGVMQNLDLLTAYCFHGTWEYDTGLKAQITTDFNPGKKRDEADFNSTYEEYRQTRRKEIQARDKVQERAGLCPPSGSTVITSRRDRWVLYRTVQIFGCAMPAGAAYLFTAVRDSLQEHIRLGVGTSVWGTGAVILTEQAFGRVDGSADYVHVAVEVTGAGDYSKWNQVANSFTVAEIQAAMNIVMEQAQSWGPTEVNFQLRDWAGQAIMKIDVIAVSAGLVSNINRVEGTNTGLPATTFDKCLLDNV